MHPITIQPIHAILLGVAVLLAMVSVFYGGWHAGKGQNGPSALEKLSVATAERDAFEGQWQQATQLRVTITEDRDRLQQAYTTDLQGYKDAQRENKKLWATLHAVEGHLTQIGQALSATPKTTAEVATEVSQE